MISVAGFLIAKIHSMDIDAFLRILPLALIAVIQVFAFLIKGY